MIEICPQCKKSEHLDYDYWCHNCHQYVKIKEVCENCLGEGYIDEDETDSDGNTANGTVTKKCQYCKI